MGRSTATQPVKAGSVRPSSQPVEARPREGYRDTVEAIVVAFILALVVRGFEAQAFVIPTGSMAPTLMGRHKEVACPQCGFVYALNASQEVESQSQREDVNAGICSNCRYAPMLGGMGGRELRLLPSLNGVNTIPAEGKSLVVVGDVADVLHFRVFDDDGKMVVDTDEGKLPGYANQIQALRDRLRYLWPPHEITKSEKSEVIGEVLSMVAQTRLDPPPSFQGDRILVMMFPYDLPFLPGAGPPERWDVVVFRYPEEPELSYIKRLIGLPGETIKIAHGDIYVRPLAGLDFRLARKPLRHQSAMLQNVYDDRYHPRALANRPEWRRWSSESGWKPRVEATGVYDVDSSPGDQWSELRYRHLVPDPEQWEAILKDQPLPPYRSPRATLVTDFYSYNTSMPPGVDLLNKPYQVRRVWMQPHWVGDLALEANIDVTRRGPGVPSDSSWSRRAFPTDAPSTSRRGPPS